MIKFFLELHFNKYKNHINHDCTNDFLFYDLQTTEPDYACVQLGNKMDSCHT